MNILNFIIKIYIGFRDGTMLYKEGAFQCPNLEATQCWNCEECNSTGIIKMGFYSWKTIESFDKIGYKLAWYKWNPLFKEQPDERT
jgi:hypothetical protein